MDLRKNMIHLVDLKANFKYLNRIVNFILSEKAASGQEHFKRKSVFLSKFVFNIILNKGSFRIFRGSYNGKP